MGFLSLLIFTNCKIGTKSDEVRKPNLSMNRYAFYVPSLCTSPKMRYRKTFGSELQPWDY